MMLLWIYWAVLLDPRRVTALVVARLFLTAQGDATDRHYERNDAVNGLMMQKQLLISSLIVHADRHHGDTEIVSRRVEGDIHRYTFRDCHRRARQMASALTNLGVKPSDRIGTLAWNGYRHLELYYGVSGMGAILHTINPRLHEDQVAYIANHAEDQYIFFDLTFLPLIKAVAGPLQNGQGVHRHDRSRPHAEERRH